MENKSNLYCYFGSFGTESKLDIPGHAFYQVGLLDSIRQTYGGGLPFSLFSYISDVEPMNNQFPTDDYGNLMTYHLTRNTKETVNDHKIVLEMILNKSFHKIFLKARFRNLSTLSKGYKDTQIFELIIQTALDAGYTGEDIFIVDTDLSLTQSFVNYACNKRIQIVTPSINFPGISKEVAEDFIKLNSKKYLEGTPSPNLVFYGNIDSNNYKKGHSKSEILEDALVSCATTKSFLGNYQNLFVISKQTIKSQKLMSRIDADLNTRGITSFTHRNDREQIWNILKSSIVSLNVTKDLYDSCEFIPARIYEAIIFGQIPVSYMFSFIEPGLSFKEISGLEEIIKFISDLSKEDQYHLYCNVAQKVINRGLPK